MSQPMMRRSFHGQFDAPVPSLALSVAVTLALFGLGLTSMRSVGFDVSFRRQHESVEVVRLVPPSPTRQVRVTPPPPVPRGVRPQTSSSAKTPAVQANTSTAGQSSLPPTTNAATDSGAKPAAAPRSNPASAIPLAPPPISNVPMPAGTSSPAASGMRNGAPIAPAALSGVHTALTPAARDSLAARQAAAMLEALRGPMPAAEAEANRKSAAAANRVRERSTTSGNSRDINIPSGAGRDGDGAVGGGAAGGSIPLPLFSSGPSAAQRKRDSVVDADNRARLGRMMEILRKRDSVRTDSVRRDSLARASRVRKP